MFKYTPSTLILPIAILLVTLTAGSAQTTGSPGKIYYQQLTAPYLDPYTTAPTAATQQWFLSHVMRMGVFSPYFDPDTAWYTAALFYDNSYAIYPGSAILAAHPEFVLHDPSGNQLYIPWNCSGGTCPSFAGDISNPAFRAWWISNAQIIMNRAPYKGIWIDDVSMNFNVSDGNGNLVAPVDFNTRLPMTYAAWRSYMAGFMQQIKAAFPKAELCENTIWFAGPSGVQEADPYVQEQIRTATNLNLEKGIVDPGMTGGMGPWSVYSWFNYIDQVHTLGPSVTFEAYQLTPAQQQYNLAAYFMISTGRDRIGDATTSPVDWFNGYSVNLGTPLGPRTYANGVYRRNFTKGIALLGEPGLAVQTIQLPGTFTDLNGAEMTSVAISGLQGIVLRGSTPKIPFTILRNLSSIKPNYIWQSSGTPQINLSIGGNPLTIDGLQYANGIGVTAYSEQHWPLFGNCTTFTATVGVDGEISAGSGSLTFQVWADSTMLYSSGTLQSGSPAAEVNVNLTGHQTLNLVVTNGTYEAPASTIHNDHADWANAIVGCTH